MAVHAKAFDDRTQLLASVATLYYEDGLTQLEIARRTGYSRSAISRLLTEAKDQGIVEVRIHYPLHRALELERQLQDLFDLDDVFVISAASLEYDRMLRLIGRAAASYLEDNAPEGGVLGVSWGTALYEVVSALRPRNVPGLKVVQMIGAVGGGDPLIDGPELARSLAANFGASYATLHAPLIVDDASIRDALLSQRNVIHAIELARDVDMAVVGIGSVEPELSSFVRAGYLSKEEMLAIQNHGAVGDICGTHFNQNGEILEIDLHGRIIGIGLADLRASHGKVIGVAGGARKAPAIAGALCGAYIDVLVTDASAAASILAEHRPDG
jgi:deoxyribonucleoside regulator